MGEVEVLLNNNNINLMRKSQVFLKIITTKNVKSININRHVKHKTCV